VKAREAGRLRRSPPAARNSSRAQANRTEAITAWTHIGQALVRSGDAADHELARSLASFIRNMPALQPTGSQGRIPDRVQPMKSIDTRLER
jgi:hypothetical protein